MSDSNQTDEKSEVTENENIENSISQAEEAAQTEEGSPAESVTPEQEGAAEEGTTAEGESEGASEAAAEAAPEPAPVPTAPRCENPIVGRKVFFVNPPLYVENYLHLELKQHEYEVYIISDFRYTKAALRHFPDALCFIFIDDEMTYDEWFNFIQSFQKEEVLKTIFVGLMSAIIPKAQHERFLMNLSLPGGFILLTEFKGSALIEKIVGILDLNGAKGRRKYLRWDCTSEDTPINGYFANGSQLLQVSIVNISSVGFVCYYPASYGDVLKKNTLIASFSITLGRRSIVTPSVVFETKIVNASKYVSIMLFSKHVGQDDRKVIKNYVFDQLQDRFEKLVFASQPDVEDYSNRGQNQAKAEEAEEELIEEAEEVLEADGAENAENTEKTEAAAAEESKETEKPVEDAEKSADADKSEDSENAEKPVAEEKAAE